MATKLGAEFAATPILVDVRDDEILDLVWCGVMRVDLHDEENQQVDPDGKISEPAESLQGPNLPDYDASSHEDDEADDETEVAFRDLRDRLAV